MSSIDLFKNNLDISIQTDDKNIDNIIDDIVSLLSIAGMQGGEVKKHFSLYAAVLFDELIEKINLKKYARYSLNIIGYPLTNAVELIDCLGEAIIKEILYKSANILRQETEVFDKEAIEIFADCLGWYKKPEEIDKETIAASVYTSFTGALNKWLNSL
ncbi:MAG: hypothetical protein F7B61_03360 [Caldisphaeraceae archaeon]|nr:hypothetical protein [Caldisphaeraceae archaeon]